jgi:methanogenic corrinoid protein MtbC1
MNDGDAMAAEILAASATAYAACASNRLLEKMPQAREGHGAVAFAHWKDHFAQRIRELSVAIAENEPALFLSRVRWSLAAFLARNVSEDLLHESLVCLHETLGEELPEHCRDTPARYLSLAIKSFAAFDATSVELEPADPAARLALQYLLQVLEGNSSGAIRLVVEAHDNGLSVEDTYQVLMTAQREIGRMWHEAEVNIAEEHIVTSTTQRAMAILAWKARKQTPNGLTVLSAAVAGNAHELGVRVISDFFEFAGWRAVCLGADLPPADIAAAVKFFEPAIVLLSAALTTQLKAVRETVQAVRDMKTPCRVMVGGTAFDDTPELWRQLGADASASTPREAVAIAGDLVRP